MARPPVHHLRAAATAAFTAAVALAAGGCGIAGHWIVRAPNHGRSLAKVEQAQTGPALPHTVIDHRFRIERPRASLAVGLIDPSNETAGPLPDHRGPGAAPESPAALPAFALNPPRPRVTRPPRGTVLIVHGFYDDSHQVRYLMWARVLAAAGYRAVLIDQRGHGASTGDFASFGVHESADLAAVLDALDARGLRTGPTAVFAVSLGAASAVRLAEADDRIDALALLSPYTSMREVIPGYGRAIGFGMLTDYAYARFIDHAGRVAGFRPDDASVIDRLPGLATPTLIFHGNQDHLIPPHHALRLEAAAARDDVQLVRIVGANHTTLGGNIAEPLRRPLLEFLQRYLFDQPLAAQRRARRP